LKQCILNGINAVSTRPQESIGQFLHDVHCALQRVRREDELPALLKRFHQGHLIDRLNDLLPDD